MAGLSEAQRRAAVDYNERRAKDLVADVRRATGLFGPNAYDGALVDAVAELQSQSALLADGKVGQLTRELISERVPGADTSLFWPASNSNEAERAAHYHALCAALGTTLASDRPTLLALRGVSLRAGTTHPTTSRRSYDDAFVLLVPKGESTEVREFSGATHPYQRASTAAPDANLDGVPDVGMVRPGRYVLHRLPGPPQQPKLWMKRLDGSPRIPAWRDFNHDGTIADAEMAMSEVLNLGPQVSAELGTYATEVLLHPGFTAVQANGKPYSSIGCQTAPLEDVQSVARFAAVEYWLLDARQVAARLGPAPA